MSERVLIVGLGNPGRKYEYTRHNLGFLAVESLAEFLKVDFKKSSFTEGLIAQGEWDSKQVVLLMPATYMNNSGAAVKSVMEHMDIALKNVLVITDDLNLPFGQIRIRRQGSEGGHNGLGSIINHLATEHFSRLRMGIGQPRQKSETVDFVLEQFTKEEKSQLDGFVKEAEQCALVWVQEGIVTAMEKYNKRS